MSNIKEESLSKALTAIRLPELPKQFRDDDNEYWLEAVVLVRKMDCTQSYALAKRGSDGRISYTADFGRMSPITGLISVHPYVFLDKEKYFAGGDMEQKRATLARFIGGDGDAEEAVKAMSDEEVEQAILNIAVETQNSVKSITATHDNIIAAVKGTSSPKETEQGDLQSQKEEEPTPQSTQEEKSDEEEVRPRRISRRLSTRTKK